MVEKVKLGDVFSRKITGEWGDECNGKTNGVGVLRTTNFTNIGKINYTNIVKRYVKQNIVEEKKLNTGDIILEKSGGTNTMPVGRVVYHDRDGCTLLCNNFTMALRVNKEIADSKYIFYTQFFLYQKGITKKFENKTTGIHNLKTTSYLNQEILLPSLEEQQHIVKVLDAISDIIEKRKQQIAKLDELEKSLFIEMFGDPITNSKNLPLEKLSNRYFLKAGVTTSPDEIHTLQDEVYTVRCFGGNGIRGYVKSETHDGIYPLIGRQGALCGNVQLAKGKIHATEHAVVVSPLKGDNPLWAYYLLKYMNLNRFQTGAAQPGLSVKILNELDIIIVDKNTQDVFLNYIYEIWNMKKLLRNSLQNIRETYNALMQQYFG